MAADDSRAERIALLKEERPDLTWRRIADEVGVSERAAFEWKKTGGIDYENAKKLAGVFGVDVEYIWTGPRGETPNPFPVSGHLDGVASEFSVRVDQVEGKLDRIDEKLEHLEQALREASVERVGLVDQILGLLRQQAELLARQTKLLKSLETAANRLPDGASLREHLGQELRDTLAQTAPPEPPARS